MALESGNGEVHLVDRERLVAVLVIKPLGLLER
jgi:hypothetical protein